ncbi:hypothetical protein A3D14_02865 [Candidatus Saccharibacteria bacterium RIFCSPHIGHO2_02_FULL_47_12]|nr:MAG: hypothetical protein A3D14_02865 [Candidatus Saccharibacteria bacterium RIFCSPHIGHO2_02_FULL_47_12]
MEVIGIVGSAGDLGSKMTVQACSAFEDVRTFDISHAERNALAGIDPLLKASEVENKPQPLNSLDAILDTCSVVHWVAPIEAVEAIPRLPKPSMLILHDSVMSNSLEVARKLSNNEAILGQIVIAHCLMNNERTVVVATDVSGTDRLVKHVEELGLHPKLSDVKGHDVVMAHSQALFAMVCKLYRKELEGYAAQGLLTPSGQRLLTAIEDNESHWTPATFAAIVSNPEIGSVIRSMLEIVEPE